MKTKKIKKLKEKKILKMTDKDKNIINVLTSLDDKTVACYNVSEISESSIHNHAWQLNKVIKIYPLSKYVNVVEVLHTLK